MPRVGNCIARCRRGSAACCKTGIPFSLVDNFSIKLYAEDLPKDISDATVKVKNATYTGEALEPKVTVKLDGKTLTGGTDYVVKYVNNVNTGIGTVVVAGIGSYIGFATQVFTIAKASNTFAVKAVRETQKVPAGETTTIPASEAFKVTKNVSEGKVTYKLTSVPKKAESKIKVSSAGRVTVKKGLKNGSYKITVQATSSATNNYKSATAPVTFTVKVK